MEKVAEEISSWDLKVFETEGPAILGKTVRYRQNYIKSGKLWIAPQVQRWIDGYFEDNDITGQFIDEKLIADPGGAVLTQEVYDAFRGFASAEHGKEHVLGRTSFYEEFVDHPKLIALGGVCRTSEGKPTRVRFGDRNSTAQYAVKGVRLKSAFEVLKE